ncbi:MAG: hypothetical protein AB8F95_16360 [Bacteroidia bacterium]
MSTQELHSKVRATKAFLGREIVRLRVGEETNETLSFREIGTRMDMIHEAERIGIRNLGESQTRKLRKMIDELEALRKVPLN